MIASLYGRRRRGAPDDRTLDACSDPCGRGDSAGCSGGSGSNLYTGSRHQERTDLGASAALTIPQFHPAQVEQRSVENLIAVGTPITERPPHRSERAQFGHSAPTLGV